MSLRIRVLLTLVILAVIAACGQQVASPSPKTEARPLTAVPPAQRANYFKAPPSMAIDAKKAYVATITTSKGTIVVSLDANAAPQTVNNFVFLVNQGFYDGLTFHRVEPGFVIQGGDPLGTGGGGPGYTVPAEIKLPHVEGAIAMARTSDQVNPKRESSGCQFYITLAPTPFLDGAYTAFGKVTQGMDVVKKIAKGDVIQQITIRSQ
jgi:peptidyl-prolyl cis-trans isomerase B (cyclophilin B)